MVKRKICLFFKIQHLERKSTDKFVQRLDLLKHGAHQAFEVNTTPKYLHQILLFA
jgi:hypothetical protein